jgi:hypothetical protein
MKSGDEQIRRRQNHQNHQRKYQSLRTRLNESVRLILFGLSSSQVLFCVQEKISVDL